jgi:hypothetical protein
MQSSPFLAAAVCVLALAGCASRNVSVQVPGKLAQPAAESVPARGKPDTWRAPVAVENLDAMNEELYADLRKNFIEPLQNGPYRYTIESIKLAAVPGLVNEWTMVMALDDGASIRVDNFSEWDERTQSYFHDGLRRTLDGLARVQKKDAALNRYVAKTSKPRKPTKADLMVARTVSFDDGE